MPKKKLGTHPKAVEARERKANQKSEEEARRQKEVEDEYWKDENKALKRKEERKHEKEHKKQDAASKKAEARALLEAEEAAIGGKKVQRVTRAQIEEQQAKEKERLQQEARRREMEAKKLSEEDILEENPNQLLRQAAMEGEVEARSVAEAISVLSVGQAKEVEKRLTYAEFEARELPLAKANNPHLKQSQVKQLVWKQWQRSPENPINAPMKVKR